jgi:hypothetical protein
VCDHCKIRFVTTCVRYLTLCPVRSYQVVLFFSYNYTDVGSNFCNLGTVIGLNLLF